MSGRVEDLGLWPGPGRHGHSRGVEEGRSPPPPPPGQDLGRGDSGEQCRTQLAGGRLAAPGVVAMGAPSNGCGEGCARGELC